MVGKCFFHSYFFQYCCCYSKIYKLPMLNVGAAPIFKRYPTGNMDENSFFFVFIVLFNISAPTLILFLFFKFYSNFYELCLLLTQNNMFHQWMGSLTRIGVISKLFWITIGSRQGQWSVSLSTPPSDPRFYLDQLNENFINCNGQNQYQWAYTKRHYFLKDNSKSGRWIYKRKLNVINARNTMLELHSVDYNVEAWLTKDFESFDYDDADSMQS